MVRQPLSRVYRGLLVQQLGGFRPTVVRGSEQAALLIRHGPAEAPRARLDPRWPGMQSR